MSFYDGISFFIILVLGFIPAIILGIKQKSQKNYILLFSIAVILLIFREMPIQLLYFVLYLFIEWHIIAVYQWTLNKWGKSPVIYRHFLIFSLLPLVISKLSGFVGHHWFSFIGISYITFRVLQIIIESYDGLIKKNSFTDTINFLIFFPSLSSGPIDRSKRFENDINEIKDKSLY